MARTDWRLLAAMPAVLAATAAMGYVELAPYEIVDFAIPDSLTGAPGDPDRGREIAASREGNCLACHHMPIPEEQFHGDVGPDLHGIGSRLTPGEIRLRIVDPQQVNPDSIMPGFYVVDRLKRVATPYAGRPILTAEQIEDLVAYLATLTDPE